MCKISVIIPIYNAERTLNRCLDSLQSQTFDDFEVLLINDGSSDKSLEICEHYCEKDNHFKLFSQVNAGPSAARNKGLDNASGDYLYFVDADDYVTSDALEQLHHAATNSGAELTICGFYRVKDDKQVIHEFPYSPGIYEGKECFNIALDLLENTSSVYLPPYSGIRMIRRDVLEKLSLKYPEDIVRSEDYLFTTILHFNINKLCLITNQPLYYYIDDEDSITNTYVKNYWQMAIKINERLKQELSGIEEVESKLNILLVFRSLIAFNNAVKANDKLIFIQDTAEILQDENIFRAIDSLTFKRGVKQFKIYYILMRLRLKSLVKYRYYIKFNKTKKMNANE